MATPTAKFAFVLCDPQSSLKPGKDLQIRSHCMLGKNKRGDSRRAQREKRRIAKEAVNSFTEEQTKDLLASNTLPLEPVISNLAVVHFAGPDIDNEAKALLFKAYAYNITDQAMTPLDRCVDLDCIESASFGWVFSDATFLHSVLCASYAAADFLTPHWSGNPGRKTLFHLRKTLSLLRMKMEDQHVYRDESVLRVVINLTLLAAVFGDWVAAAAHFEGLHRIITLRGGTTFLSTRAQLHFKIDRIDLAWYLSSGGKPLFVQATTSWEPIIPAPYLPLPPGLYQPSPTWNFGLVAVFQDLQYLSLRINRNRLKHARYNPACFQGHLTSVQSRLVNLGDLLTSPVERLIRLTMLAFMTTMFKIPGRKIPYKWVVGQLNDNYNEAVDSSSGLDSTLRLWVLVTVAITVAGTREGWVKKAWATINPGLDWAGVKDNLVRVMWIEIIHDKVGELACKQFEESLRKEL